MPHAIVLQHIQHEDCGRIAALIDARGLTRENRLLHQGDPVPTPDERCDLLVVMGGPMGVGDIGDRRYPWLAREVELLRDRMRRDLPTLGICLGAQLMAHAAGAAVGPNLRSPAPGQPPRHVLEVGWGVTDFHLATGDAALTGIGPHEVMLHWHGDTFELPTGALLLASTPRCPNQGFRLGRNLYGLQFHCEIEAETVKVWTVEDREYVRRANGDGGDYRLVAAIPEHMPRHREVGDRLLGNILDEIGFPLRLTAQRR
jgi:GMP synthase-like glutamine amidotransferase